MKKHSNSKGLGVAPAEPVAGPSAVSLPSVGDAATVPNAEEQSFRITPKGVVFITLGGYSTPGAEEAANKVMEALSRHMGDGSTAIVKYVNGSLGWEELSFDPPQVERASWWKKLFPTTPTRKK